MLIPLALGAAALYGLYRYDQNKKAMAAALAPANAQNAAQDPAGATYPQATSTSDPKQVSVQNAIKFYQKAQPIPSGKTYYPADGDSGIVIAIRFSPAYGNTTSEPNPVTGLVLKHPGSGPAEFDPVASEKDHLFWAEFAKLNGTIGTLQDLGRLAKAKTPFLLPTTATDKGKRPAAMGDVR